MAGCPGRLIRTSGAREADAGTEVPGGAGRKARDAERSRRDRAAPTRASAASTPAGSVGQDGWLRWTELRGARAERRPTLQWRASAVDGVAPHAPRGPNVHGIVEAL